MVTGIRYAKGVGVNAIMRNQLNPTHLSGDKIMRLIRYTSPVARAYHPAFNRSPWAGLEAQMDRLFDAALGETVGAAADRFPVDLYEDAHATYVRAELPGVNRADIGVELVEGSLQITAKRVVKEGEREEAFELSRSLTVPENAVQADRISAAYEHGVLTVTLPKREEAKPRKISVTVA
jgi:HSP20 family protein